jgi:hypothetical protein
MSNQVPRTKLRMPLKNYSDSELVTTRLKKVRQYLAGTVAVLLSFSAGSADLQDVHVDMDNKRYYVRSEAWFDASVEQLYHVLTDYELFRKFTSAIVESKNIEPDEAGRPGFYTRMEGCLLFWCQTFERNGYLLLTPESDVVAITNPENSDFKFATERWRLEPEGDGTRMTYSFEMEPDFWVPPVVGPFVIKRSLKRGGADAIDRIEALAQGKEPNFD